MKRIITQIVSGFVIMAALLLPTIPVAADPVDVFGPACKGSSENSVCPQSGESKLFPTVKNIINILLFITGIIAVVMIIVAGISYVLSNGDQNRVTIAKNTILYAVVGLVIASLAFTIVNFVIGNI